MATHAVARAKEVLRIEAEAIRTLIPRIGRSFQAAVQLLIGCKGRVIVTGMGKAGLIGQKIAAQTPSFQGRDFRGVIEDIDSRIDPTSRTVIVRANIPNNEDLLRPGLSFVVDLTIPGEMYPTVHQLALQWRKGKSFVWRLKDNRAEKVMVRSVKRLHSTILIEGDISKGDLIVVEGVQRLRPGRRVRFSMPDPVPSS